MNLNLHRRTYVILCLFACVTPLILVRLPSGVLDEVLLAAAGNLALSVLTYPAGIVGTIAFFALIFVGLATPTEAVLCAAPLYIGAGYFQWYVLIPKHFLRSL
jgi:hypothetical protein